MMAACGERPGHVTGARGARGAPPGEGRGKWTHRITSRRGGKRERYWYREDNEHVHVVRDWLLITGRGLH